MSRLFRAATTSTTTNSNAHFWSTAIATVPVLLWARDSLVGTCRVHGSSMEPTLRHGDVVLVRKSDLGVIPETIWNILAVGGDANDDYDVAIDRARLLQYDSQNQIGGHHASRFYENPPVALSGHVAVFKDPEKGIPAELCVKRVIGVGGQLVRPRRTQEFRQARRLQQVPSYSLYVEGDNCSNSRDSRQTGPISKGLLVGVAEYVIWPPTRMGRILRTTPSDDKGRPRSSWP